MSSSEFQPAVRCPTPDQCIAQGACLEARSMFTSIQAHIRGEDSLGFGLDEALDRSSCLKARQHRISARFLVKELEQSRQVVIEALKGEDALNLANAQQILA